MPALSVRKVREALGFTQDGLAEGSDLSQSRISEIEGRALARQRVDTLSRYAAGLGADLVLAVYLPDEDRVVVLRSPDRAPRQDRRRRGGPE